MIEAIKVYPVFGRGLGQIGVYDRKLVYNILIHNSFFGVFIIFGISALAYIIPILTSFYRAIKRDKMVLILVADLFFVFIATGSFLSLEMPLIYCIFLMAVNYKQKYKGMNNYEI
jgi:Ca2+/Na+ antiporter